MNAIPKKLREEMARDPYYKKCCLKDEYCSGKIEWHHALQFAGKQVQRKFAILPACEFHHDSAWLYKKRFHWVALNRATKEELEEFKKANFKRELIILNKIFNRYGRQKK